MKYETSQTIITANDLLSGEVVYLTSSGKWSPDHGDAIAFDEMHLAKAHLDDVQRLDQSIVGPYLAGAAIDGNLAPSPVHFREVFRTRGPSNRALGKQAHTA